MVANVKGVYIKNTKILEFIRRFTVIVIMLAQIVLFGLYADGIVRIFGRDVALMEAIDLWLSIFSTSVLRGLLYAVVGVIYIVIFIIMIKNIIQSLTHFSKAFSGKRDDKTAAEWMHIFDRMSSGMYCVAWFMIIARLINVYKINDNAVTIFFMGAGFYLFSRFAITIWEDGDVLKALYKLLTNFLHMSAMILFIISICKTDMQFFVPGIEFLVNYIENADSSTNKSLLKYLFMYVIRPAFYIFMQVIALMIAKNSIFYVDYENYKCKGLIKKAIIASAVLPVIAVVVTVFMTGEFVIDDLKILREYIPAILCSVAVLLTYNFCYCDSARMTDKGSGDIVDTPLETVTVE